MDAIKNLVDNVPNWITRLDELSGKISFRQNDLREAEERTLSSAPSSAKRSMRPRGSTESLRPTDDDPVPDDEQPMPQAMPPPMPPPPMPRGRSVSPAGHPPLKRNSLSNPLPFGEPQPPSSPNSNGHSNTPSALQRHTQQVHETANQKARKWVKIKHPRADSVVTVEGRPKYRTRSMVIVYYDSYVQIFFEELVKFVSASRNMIRKAKLAARIGRIKQLADMELPDEMGKEKSTPVVDGTDAKTTNGTTAKPEPLLEASSTNDEAEDEAPPLQFLNSRPMRSSNMLISASGQPIFTRMAEAGGINGFAANRLGLRRIQAPDAFMEIDKGLEYVQSMSEHAAHQFLRDGSCEEEIENIKRRLLETRELADKEMERVKREEPDALITPEEPPKTRSFRPQTMRRDGLFSALEKGKERDEFNSGSGVLEVDEGIDDMDEDQPPTLFYKSTRLMR